MIYEKSVANSAIFSADMAEMEKKLLASIADPNMPFSWRRSTAEKLWKFGQQYRMTNTTIDAD